MPSSNPSIVVAVDYSDSAIAAVDKALTFAASCVSAVLAPILVLPGGPATSPMVAVTATEELVEQSKKNLDSLVETRAKQLGIPVHRSGKLSVRPIVTFGDPAVQITENARQLKAELIVVGTHGRRGVQHFLLGSVAEEVVRKAECSVLVARVSDGEEARGQVSSAVAVQTEGMAPASSDWVLRECIVGEPHIEGDAVVLHVLDRPSGLTFECRFAGFDELVVESLEREWVTASSGEQRARAARAALAFSQTEQGLFEELFEELARRKKRA